MFIISSLGFKLGTDDTERQLKHLLSLTVESTRGT